MMIAVDGTMSSGKGTLARRLAAHYGLPHLDTGLLYRAVGMKCLREGIDFADSAACGAAAASLDLSDFDEAELRTAAAGSAASKVAAHPPVRAALLEMQRAFAHQPGGAVLDGRDIGTVIAPDADVKFWVDADIAVRARRRSRELTAAGQPISEADMLAHLRERDARDAGRADAPMVAAADAVRIDTTAMTIDEVVAAAVRVVEARISQ